MSRVPGEASSGRPGYLFRMRMVPPLLVLAVMLSGCAERRGSTLCGISLLASPVVIRDQFAVPRQTLSFPPRNMPEEIPVRFAADALVRGLVGMTDSLLVIGVDQPMPGDRVPGFGVLVTDLNGDVKGVMVFDGDPVPGAPTLGTIHVGNRSAVLLGVRIDFARIEDPRCPLFPPPEPR